MNETKQFRAWLETPHVENKLLGDPYLRLHINDGVYSDHQPECDDETWGRWHLLNAPDCPDAPDCLPLDGNAGDAVFLCSFRDCIWKTGIR